MSFLLLILHEYFLTVFDTSLASITLTLTVFIPIPMAPFVAWWICAISAVAITHVIRQIVSAATHAGEFARSQLLVLFRLATGTALQGVLEAGAIALASKVVAGSRHSLCILRSRLSLVDRAASWSNVDLDQSLYTPILQTKSTAASKRKPVHSGSRRIAAVLVVCVLASMASTLVNALVKKHYEANATRNGLCAHGTLSSSRRSERSAADPLVVKLRWCCPAGCPHCGGNKTHSCRRLTLASGVPSGGACCPFGGVAIGTGLHHMCKTKKETACAVRVPTLANSRIGTPPKSEHARSQSQQKQNATTHLNRFNGVKIRSPEISGDHGRPNTTRNGLCAHGTLSSSRRSERSAADPLVVKLRWCCPAGCPHCGGNKTHSCRRLTLASGVPSGGACCPFGGVDIGTGLHHLCRTKKETACAVRVPTLANSRIGTPPYLTNLTLPT